MDDRIQNLSSTNQRQKMSPGINDGPRYTGTVPKSNRRNDRNRERSNSNQITRSTDPRDVLHQPNNLLDWHLVTDPQRTEKNSNTRSTSSAPSIGYQDFAEFDCGGQQRNYIFEERSQWQRMAPPDSHTQSPPPSMQGSKPTNVDKMPDRVQVESRLNQIRDYIRVTSTMMDSLSHSSDPRAISQHEKLCKMVEDLYDSETKLAKLLETYQNQGIPDESGDHPEQRSDHMRRFSDLMDVLTLQERFIMTNPNCMNGEGDNHGDGGREAQLHRKVEETQRKLAQLQEQEASLLGMQLRARERLNEARQAQQLFLQQEQANGTWEGSERQQQGQVQPDQLESDHAALRGKLVQLQNKKKRMDHLVAELQAVDSFDRGSCSSEGSRAVPRDKVAELDAMKAQLAHLKALMEEATRDRNLSDSEVEPEADEEVQAEVLVNSSRNSIDRQSDPDDSLRRKSRNSVEKPSVDQIQAVTRELREQSVLLQAARAELQRLKQTTPIPTVTSSTPPPSLLGLNISEKKQSNHNTNNNNNDDRNEIQLAQAKRRQLEELMRKEQGHSSSVNQDVSGGDWGGTRDSNSQLSHTSVAANLWPLPTPAGSNELSVDDVSTAGNLLDGGSNGNAATLNGNWWGIPPPLGIIDQPPQGGMVGTAEYYRQLLLGSQAQQLQMMGMTMQQCCQLLWAQQRELQSMRAAIVQLQLQLRQPQEIQQPSPSRPNNSYSNSGIIEDYSNLSRAAPYNGNAVDSTLPPSSSLPNLIALPTPTPTPAPVPVPNPPHQQQQQQQQQQQLNNQVPPGNRANNYWDNFRSYSRQNLLSVNGKSGLDRNPHTTPCALATNTVSTAPSTASGGGSNAGLTSRKDKRNREHGLENLSLPTLLATQDMQYPQHLPLQSNFQQQEAIHSRSSLSNVLANDTTQPQPQCVDNYCDEQQSACTRLLPASNDGQVLLRQLSDEMSDAVASLVLVNTSRPGYLVRVLREMKIICEDHRLRPRLLRSLQALRDSHSPNNPLVGWLQNETTDQTASESCQSSDEDSDTGTLNNVGANAASSTCGASSLPPPPLPPPPLPLPLPLLPVVASSDNVVGFQAESLSINASISVTPGYNEDLAEADQSRPEASHNPQIPSEEYGPGEHGGTTASANPLIAELVADLFEGEAGTNEDSGLDRVPTRLYHQADESA